VKINRLIRLLEEAREYAGADIDVVVGETNGMLIGKIGVNVDSKGKYDNEHWDEKIAIVQGYIVFR